MQLFNQSCCSFLLLLQFSCFVLLSLRFQLLSVEAMRRVLERSFHFLFCSINESSVPVQLRDEKINVLDGLC